MLGPGTLYGAIQTLTKKGWIRIYSAETDSRRKKEYLLTEEGKAVFEAEKRRLEELLENAALMEGEQEMTKFRLYFDKDKETRWLNEQAAEGIGLTIIALFTLVLMRSALKLNRMIARLKAQNGEPVSEKGTMAHRFIVAGMLLNSAAIIAAQLSPGSWGHFVQGAAQGIAIVLLVIGAVQYVKE